MGEGTVSEGEFATDPGSVPALAWVQGDRERERGPRAPGYLLSS